eukprot:CAMPEP_0194531678 /NCGR_PEP_ID=MMETSP0253-20130528/69034_1 /TAXON_ID=2966 /ORGANISM="Noctiluca scintillans" /LENGTH=334 /DNA_ID=CAMNT_0039377047 /DNA_START=104 /DNA_END=1105 /DNA_ORIENTATION=+
MTAFATLSIAHAPLWDAIRVETARGSADFAPRDLETMVLSFATMRIDAPDLFNSVAQQAVMKMNKFTSLDVATMAYAFALVGRRDEVLMDKLAIRALTLIKGGSFPSQALSSISWGFDTLSFHHHELFQAIAKEILRPRPQCGGTQLDRLDLEHLVVLVDCDLPCREQLLEHLGAVLFHFIRFLPQSPDGWRSEECWTLVKGLRVDNFGKVGTAYVLFKLGIGEANVNFLERAREGFLDLVQRSRRSFTELVRAGTAVNRDGALLEYEVKVPGKSTLRGTIVKEHGTKAFSMGRFQSCSLSTGSHADRSWRGEVLVLEEFCHIFGVHGVIGTAR